MTAVEQQQQSVEYLVRRDGESNLQKISPRKPISIYEIDLSSWMRVPEEGNRPLRMPEIAPKLIGHVRYMSFTHVALLSSAVTDPGAVNYLISRLYDEGFGVIIEQEGAIEAGAAFKISDKNESVLSGWEYKWDAAWARETLDYFGEDPFFRKFHQDLLTRRESYAFTANYILPLSRGFVNRNGRSLFESMPGDDWKKFANLRLLFAYMWALPGKKLLFMGTEFGQRNLWNPNTSLDWHLARPENSHGKLLKWVSKLNRLYLNEPALYKTDSSAGGFEWIDTTDSECSVISFLRKAENSREALLAVFNFTPVPRHNYRIGAPRGGFWREVMNSDALEYGGSGQGNLGGVEAAPFGWHYRSHSLVLTLPPLGAVFLKAPC